MREKLPLYLENLILSEESVSVEFKQAKNKLPNSSSRNYMWNA